MSEEQRERIRSEKVKADAQRHALAELSAQNIARLTLLHQQRKEAEAARLEQWKRDQEALMRLYNRQKLIAERQQAIQQSLALEAHRLSLLPKALQQAQPPPLPVTADDIKKHQAYRFYSRKAQQWLLEHLERDVLEQMGNHSYRLALEQNIHTFPWATPKGTPLQPLPQESAPA